MKPIRFKIEGSDKPIRDFLEKLKQDAKAQSEAIKIESRELNLGCDSKAGVFYVRTAVMLMGMGISVSEDFIVIDF
jgi:hypothetical protein